MTPCLSLPVNGSPVSSVWSVSGPTRDTNRGTLRQKDVIFYLFILHLLQLGNFLRRNLHLLKSGKALCLSLRRTGTSLRTTDGPRDDPGRQNLKGRPTLPRSDSCLLYGSGSPCSYPGPVPRPLPTTYSGPVPPYLRRSHSPVGTRTKTTPPPTTSQCPLTPLLPLSSRVNHLFLPPVVVSVSLVSRVRHKSLVERPLCPTTPSLLPQSPSLTSDLSLELGSLDKNKSWSTKGTRNRFLMRNP